MYAPPTHTGLSHYQVSSNHLKTLLTDYNHDHPGDCGMQIKSSWIQEEDTGALFSLPIHNVVSGPVESPGNLLNIQFWLLSQTEQLNQMHFNKIQVTDSYAYCHRKWCWLSVELKGTALSHQSWRKGRHEFHPMGMRLDPVCVGAQSCLTLCNPMDCSAPGLSTHGIFQARILEWVAISFSRGQSRSRDRSCVSCISCTSRQFFTNRTTSEALLTSTQTCGSAMEPRPFVHVAQPNQEAIPAFDQEPRSINPSSINCH